MGGLEPTVNVAVQCTTMKRGGMLKYCYWVQLESVPNTVDFSSAAVKTPGGETVTGADIALPPSDAPIAALLITPPSLGVTWAHSVKPGVEEDRQTYRLQNGDAILVEGSVPTAPTSTTSEPPADQADQLPVGGAMTAWTPPPLPPKPTPGQWIDVDIDNFDDIEKIHEVDGTVGIRFTNNTGRASSHSTYRYGDERVPQPYDLGTKLVAVDVSQLADVKEFEGGFLCGCKGLVYLDLTPIGTPETTGWSFLAENTSLFEVKLAMPRLHTISGRFLADCKSLTAFDMACFTNLRLIEGPFMPNCTSLTKLDLSTLHVVQRIGNDFLKGCTSLTHLDLSGLSNVTEIGECFMNDCTALTALDVTPFSKVTKVGPEFLKGCTKLTRKAVAGTEANGNLNVREEFHRHVAWRH